jgi:hypothetical protein
MWVHWRAGWVQYFERLLETIDTPDLPAEGTSDPRLQYGGMSSTLLKGLTRLAANYEPDAVAQQLNDLAIYAVREGSDPNDPFRSWWDIGLASSDDFFNALISKVFCAEEPVDQPLTRIEEIKGAARRWFPPMQDPLQISQDPECRYGTPSGCIN